MSKFHAFFHGDLPTLQYFDSAEKARQSCESIRDCATNPEAPIIVREVRPAAWSDFFPSIDFFGMVSERMTALVGNSAAVDELSDDERAAFEGALSVEMDAVAERVGIPMVLDITVKETVYLYERAK